MNSETRRGWRTSEFWLSLVAMVVGVLLGSGVWGEGDATYRILGFVAASLTALGYVVSRGGVKKAELLSAMGRAPESVKNPDP